STPETSRRLRSQIRESPDSPGRFTVLEPRVDTLTSRPGGGGWGWGVEPPGAAVAEVIARHSASFDMYTGRLFAVSLLPGSPDRLVLTASRLCVDDASWQTVVEDLVRQYDESVLVPAR
ncbi:hypothetical protein T602_00001, partial [Mycobacterium tuberculosis UT0084]